MENLIAVSKWEAPTLSAATADRIYSFTLLMHDVHVTKTRPTAHGPTSLIILMIRRNWRKDRILEVCALLTLCSVYRDLQRNRHVQMVLSGNSLYPRLWGLATVSQT